MSNHDNKNQEIVFGFFSDTHLREDLIFPEIVDVFFHCGDLLNKGSLNELGKATKVFKEGLKGRQMYFTPGNHDNIFESSKDKEAIQILKDAGIETLIDQRLTLDCKGHRISCYFMPWVPEIALTHAFNLSDDQRKKFIDDIPDDIDILITHGPPSNILDYVPHRNWNWGDDLLLEKLSFMKTRLKIHAFGHVHEDRGTLRDGEESPLFINASIGDIQIAKPIMITWPSLTRL